jgi:uncharacterized protein YecT (DUF1311 family)
MLCKQYDELLTKISETEVDKWTKIADRDCKYAASNFWSCLADVVEVQGKMAKDNAKRYEQLKDILNKLDSPIMQIADGVATIQDKFNGKL